MKRYSVRFTNRDFFGHVFVPSLLKGRRISGKGSSPHSVRANNIISSGVGPNQDIELIAVIQDFKIAFECLFRVQNVAVLTYNDIFEPKIRLLSSKNKLFWNTCLVKCCLAAQLCWISLGLS